MREQERVALLKALLSMDGSVSEVLGQLAEFPWDSEEELVQLERRHVREVLRKYLEGRVTSDEVENWAEALESRDDVGFAEPIVQDVMWTLANPELAEPLSTEVTKDVLERLEATSAAGVAPRE
jgi:hypothetical protein